MSIDDATAADWDRISKKSQQRQQWWEENEKQKIPLPDPVDWLDDTSQMKRYDIVDKPAHYNNGAIEAIDYIKQQLGENFFAYCEGNVHKYIHRYSYKNGVEDLRKARWYLDRMIKELCTDGL